MEEFDVWNELKKKIEIRDYLLDKFPKEGEIWISSIGKNIGFEQNGKGEVFSRPVLVVKKFNNQMFWIVPLSSKQKNFDFYFNYKDSLGRKVSVILAQMKLMSLKRFIRDVDQMDTDLFLEIKKKLSLLLL
jgi:mRNA interferase MazF